MSAEKQPSSPDNGALIMSAEKQPSSPDNGALIMSAEKQPSSPDNGALIMSAEKQPSSPDRGRRAPSDDREHILQIHDMASPPYAYTNCNGDLEAAREKGRQNQKFTSDMMIGDAASRMEMYLAWKELVELVARLASGTELRPWDTLSLTTQESLGRLFAGDARPYYDTKYASAALVEAWLWHALDDNLFSDPDKWATPQWKAYGTLDAFFHHRAGTLDSAITREEHGESGVYAEREFHAWRLITSRIMVNTILAQDTSVRDPDSYFTDRPAVQHTSVDRLADRLMGKLAEITDEAKNPLSWYEDRVRRTARFAVSIDLQIIQSIHHHMIAWRFPSLANAAAMKGHPFRKSAVLEAYDVGFENEGRPIDFVVSPGIFISGLERHQFHEGRWVNPIRVAVNGTLDDNWADIRSAVTMNLTGS
ncbi:hypothetical protein B0T16DRAFT_397374 [Cercophora newfieldiana]|uniref:Uncharacterized protein n=1 Tax=Cercophora newfieldiana TaxID=92897 RepID=A0AA39YQR0_9PEZI|nr:hypothetical protein B0T16DRAFT_397374 [Cercophora newfieldiana]